MMLTLKDCLLETITHKQTLQSEQMFSTRSCSETITSMTAYKVMELKVYK